MDDGERNETENERFMRIVNNFSFSCFTWESSKLFWVELYSWKYISINNSNDIRNLLTKAKVESRNMKYYQEKINYGEFYCYSTAGTVRYLTWMRILITRASRGQYSKNRGVYLNLLLVVGFCGVYLHTLMTISREKINSWSNFFLCGL